MSSLWSCIRATAPAFQKGTLQQRGIETHAPPSAPRGADLPVHGLQLEGQRGEVGLLQDGLRQAGERLLCGAAACTVQWGGLSPCTLQRHTEAAALRHLPLVGPVQLRLFPSSLGRSTTSIQVQLRQCVAARTLGRQQALSPHAVLQIGPEEDQLLRAVSYLQRQNVRWPTIIYYISVTSMDASSLCRGDSQS